MLICVGYIVGLMLPGSGIHVCVCLGALWVMGIWLILSQHYGRTRLVCLISVWLSILLFCFFGCLRIKEYNAVNEYYRHPAAEGDAVVVGVVDDISIKDNSYSVTLLNSEIHFKTQSFITRKILSSIPGELYVPSVGDRLFISGSLYTFEPASNPGQFDALKYYTVRGYDAGIFADNVIKDETFNAGIMYKIKNILFRVRCFMTDNLYAVLPKNSASVMVSIITGDRGRLDKDIKNLYLEGGIAHILSISSLHITILGMGIFRLLLRLFSRLKLSIFMTLLIISGYGCMTGFSVSTSRAILMITVMLLGKLFAKAYDMPSSIGLAALLILIKNPGMVDDSGFLLSFSAVIGICITGEIITEFNIRNNAAKSLAMSGGVWLFTLPIILNTYYTLNLCSIFINLLILPLMSILLVTGFICGLFGSIFLAGPLYYILEFYEKVCLLEKQIPIAKLVIGNRSQLSIFMYYTILLLMRYLLIRSLKSKSDAGKKYIFLALSAIVIILIPQSRPKNVFNFIDVGQGDSIYFRLGDETFLMDCGSSDINSVGEYRIIPFLKYSGVSQIDHLIISHSDGDHISALDEFLEAGYPKINEVIFNIYDTGNSMIDKLKDAGVNVSFLCEGDIVYEDTISTYDKNSAGVYVLAPDKESAGKDINSNSLVLEAVLGDVSVLLTGDSDFESEEKYVNNIRRTALTVLKCAHHGSKYSTSDAFLSEINPMVSVISCSAANNYNHPSPELIDRLIKAGTEIYITKDSGMVDIVISDSDSICVRTFR